MRMLHINTVHVQRETLWVSSWLGNSTRWFVVVHEHVNIHILPSLLWDCSVSYCCFLGCQSVSWWNTENACFHKFPFNRKLKAQWVFWHYLLMLISFQTHMSFLLGTTKEKYSSISQVLLFHTMQVNWNKSCPATKVPWYTLLVKLFERDHLFWPRLHLFDQKYNKDSNTVFWNIITI